MKYKNFRTIARVFVVLAWVMAIGTLGISLIAGFLAGGTSIIMGIIVGLVGGLLSFVFLYALAQFIYVVIDIERNTRATLRALLEEVEVEAESDKTEGE
jgi:uncharacterized membrane protein